MKPRRATKVHFCLNWWTYVIKKDAESGRQSTEAQIRASCLAHREAICVKDEFLIRCSIHTISWQEQKSWKWHSTGPAQRLLPLQNYCPFPQIGMFRHLRKTGLSTTTEMAWSGLHQFLRAEQSSTMAGLLGERAICRYGRNDTWECLIRSSTSGWHSESVYVDDIKLVVARSFTADGNLLQLTGSVNRTPSHVTFSHVSLHSKQCRTWHWLEGVVRVSSHPCFMWLCVFDSLRLSTLHSSQSLSSSTSSSWSSSSLSMWVGSERSTLVRFREWGAWLFCQQRPSHTLWLLLHWSLVKLGLVVGFNFILRFVLLLRKVDEDRTPCRHAHFSQCGALVHTDHHTHLRVAQVWGVLHVCRHLKSHPLTTCFIESHSWMCLKPISFLLFHATWNDSSGPTHWQLPALLCWLQLRRSPRHSARRISVWPPGRTQPSHRSRSPIPASMISSEHTPVNYSSKGESASTPTRTTSTTMRRCFQKRQSGWKKWLFDRRHHLVSQEREVSPSVSLVPISTASGNQQEASSSVIIHG